MSRIFILAALTLWNATGWTQNRESLDSVANTRNLNEVTVYAKDTQLGVGEISFIPTSREKRSASGGYQLIRMMNLPLVDVDVSNRSVRNISGAEVSVYVNGIKASPNEIDGILCTDVKKVLYLEMPKDPKYGSDRYVIDFMLVKYIYGGYSKFSAQETAPPAIDVNISGYSKMSYKNMTYDLNAGYGVSDKNRGGYIGREEFLLETGVLSRKEFPAEYREKQRNIFAAFRATYERENAIFSNVVSFTRSNNPESYLSDNVETSMNNGGMTMRESSRNSNSKYTSAGWKASGIINLANGWSLNLTPSLNIGRNESNSLYSLIHGPSIRTHASEHNIGYDVAAGTIKSFSRFSSLFLKLSANGIANKVTYTGDTEGTERFDWNCETMRIGYSYQNRRFFLAPEIGLVRYSNSINNYRETIFYPNLNLNSQVLLNDRNYLILWLQYNTLAPGIREKGTLTIREDDRIWFKGNPDIHTYRIFQTTFTYLWLAHTRFDLTGSFFISNHRNRITYEFTRFNEGVLRYPINSGNYLSSAVSIKGTLSLLDKSLKVSLLTGVNLNRSTGLYNIEHWSPSLILSANYYAAGFYFAGNFRLSSQYFTPVSSEKMRVPTTYDISAGWANANWNINLKIANFLSYKWEGKKSSFMSEFYRKDMTMLGSAYRCNFDLKVTYSFGYGKKVNKRDEVQRLQENESAINKF